MKGGALQMSKKRDEKVIGKYMRNLMVDQALKEKRMKNEDSVSLSPFFLHKPYDKKLRGGK